tara:strand:+ start:150 stop:362 length:213 start_codon:yes stop_codon:yes gene_type:complete
MAHDEYNSGMRRGYNNALRVLREVDRQIEYPDHYERDQKEFLKYHIQKDLLHKIYSLIKEDKEELTDEEF